MATTALTALKHSSNAKSIGNKRYSAKKLHTRTQRSQTLMRQLLKKPVVHPTVGRAKHQKPTQRVIAVPKIVLKQSSRSAQRAENAKKIAKVAQVSHFGQLRNSYAGKKYSPNATVAQRPKTIASSIESMTGKSTVASRAKTASSQQIFYQAMAQANSHTKPRLAKKRRLRASSQKLSKLSVGRALALAATLAVVGAYLTNSGLKSWRLSSASHVAGIEAKMPGYVPSGFGHNGPIQAANGKVVIRFGTHSDDRSFSLSQAVTNSVLPSGTYTSTESQQSGNKTIYFLPNAAAWIKDGMEYRIDIGNSNLSREQVVHIANSL